MCPLEAESAGLLFRLSSSALAKIINGFTQ